MQGSEFKPRPPQKKKSIHDMLNNKYEIKQHKTKQLNISQYSTRQTFIVLNNFWSCSIFYGQKSILVF